MEGVAADQDEAGLLKAHFRVDHMVSFSRIVEAIKNPLKVLEQHRLWERVYTDAHGTFVDQIYYWMVLHLKPNTVVIDLGAGWGDTAIYFAQFPNVKKVIALEPVPKLYNYAKRFISESPFKNKIHLLNAAVGNKSGKRISQSGSWYNGSFSRRTGDSTGKKIEVYPLNYLMRSISGPIAIKCDIEGDADAVFRNANLSKVYLFIGDRDKRLETDLETILKNAGFKTQRTRDSPDADLLAAWRG